MPKTQKSTQTTVVGNGNEEGLARLQNLRKEAEELEVKLGLSRGTGDLTAQAHAASKGVRVGGDLSIPLSERIEAALKARPHSIEDLARDLKEPAGKISAALKSMRKQLFNAGTEHAPAWFWIVGDHAPTEQVNAAVEALVRFKPMRFPELRAATGARPGRVSGAIVKIQRDPNSRLAKLDNEPRARWFLVPEGIQLSKLKSR